MLNYFDRAMLLTYEISLCSVNWVNGVSRAKPTILTMTAVRFLAREETPPKEMGMLK